MIHGSKLIQDNLAALCQEAASDSKRVRPARRGERCNDRSPQMGVELVWRNDDAGAGLADFASAGRVEGNEEDLPAPNRSLYHCQSSSSNRVGVGASRSRSPSSSRNF